MDLQVILVSLEYHYKDQREIKESQVHRVLVDQKIRENKDIQIIIELTVIREIKEKEDSMVIKVIGWSWRVMF